MNNYKIYITKSVQAAYLISHGLTVQKLCRRGELPGYKLAGRKWRIPRDKLRAVLEGGNV